jgi:putative sterol carrier protein
MNLSPEMLESLNSKAESAAPIGGTMKFTLGNNTYFIDGNGAKNVFSMEDKDADCSISMSEDNFQKLVAGKLNPMMAVMTGKIKIKGDMSLAMKLKDLMG